MTELQEYIQQLIWSMYADSFNYVKRVAPKDEISGYKISDSVIEKFGRLVYALSATYITHLLNIEAMEGIRTLQDTEHLKNGQWGAMYKALLFSSDEMQDGQREFSVKYSYFDVGIVDLMNARLITDYQKKPIFGFNDRGHTFVDKLILQDFNEEGIFYLIIATENPALKSSLAKIGMDDVLDFKSISFLEELNDNLDLIRELRDARLYPTINKWVTVTEKYTIRRDAAEDDSPRVTSCSISIRKETDSKNSNAIPLNNTTNTSTGSTPTDINPIHMKDDTDSNLAFIISYDDIEKTRHRLEITLTNNNKSVDDYNHKLILDSNNFNFNMAKDDLTDLRFYADKLSTHPLKYYIYDKSDDRAVIAVKIPHIIGANVNGDPSITKFYMLCDGVTGASYSDQEPFMAHIDDETFSSSANASIQLNHTDIIRKSEVITSGDTTFKRETDYTIDYEVGIINVVSDNMANAGTCNISYDYIQYTEPQLDVTFGKLIPVLPDSVYNSITKMLGGVSGDGVKFTIKNLGAIHVVRAENYHPAQGGSNG